MVNEEVICRSCGSAIRLRKKPSLGGRMDCPKCGTRLEIIGVEPLEVDWAFDGPIEETPSDLLPDELTGERGVAVV